MQAGNPVSASKYWLARQCLHPWTSGLAWPARKTSWAARLGSYAHRKLECLVTGVPDDTGIGLQWGATPRMRSLAEACASSGAAYLTETSLIGGNGMVAARAEIAYRCSLSDGPTPTPVATELFLGSHRAYPPLPGLYGTADVVASRGGELLVSDWKTGLSSAPYSEHARWQLRQLGVAACLASEAEVSTVQLDAVYVKKDGSRPWVQREVFATDSQDWKDIVEDVTRTVKRLYGPPEGPQPGPHCRHCPVRVDCPEAL